MSAEPGGRGQAAGEPLLRVRDLVKHFPLGKGLLPGRRGWVKAVDGVSFDVFRGETLGLVGESGCGKSTTGRAVLRLIEPTSGEVCFGGEDVLAMDREALRRLRRRAQIVFQDPFSSLNPRMTVGQALDEVLKVHGLGGGKDSFRSMPAGTPTSSAAGSASGSGLLVRSPWNRTSSSVTNLFQRWMSRFRRRSSISSRSCSESSG